MEMWDDGDGGGVSTIQWKQTMRGSGGKVHRKIKVRKMVVVETRGTMPVEEEITGSMNTVVLDMWK